MDFNFLCAFKFFAPIFFIFQGSLALAQETWVLIPKWENRKPISLPFTVRPLFSKQEQIFLKKNGKSFLAGSLEVSIADKKAENTFKKWFRESGVQEFELEETAPAIPQSYENLKWGVQNLGQPQSVAIDHFTSGTLAGIPGEDFLGGKITEWNLLPEHKEKKVVAVLDTGVDLNHPFLKSRLHSKGWNVISSNDQTQDTHGHGTHVAGIVLSASKNTQILPIKVIQSGPNAPIRPQMVDPDSVLETALSHQVAKGILKSIELGANVINMSLAWPISFRSKLVEEMIKLAEAKSVLIVSSAGNDQTQAWVYPCAYASVICVGSHGPDGAFSHFSNYGNMVDILAPGVAILSTWPTNKTPSAFAGGIGHEYRNGTSMAAPFVAGALGELIAQGLEPKLARNNIKLNTRSTHPTTQYASPTIGPFLQDSSKEKPFARFGNLDFFRALYAKPKPLISLKNKTPANLVWTGTGEEPYISQNLTVELVNEGAEALEVTIRSEFFSEKISKWKQSETRIISFPFKFSPNSPSQQILPITVAIKESSEQDSTEQLGLTVRLVRKLDPITLNPSFISTSKIASPISMRNKEVREVLGTNSSMLAITEESEALLVENQKALGTIHFGALTSDSLLSVHKTPTGEYAFIFTDPKSNPNRPVFLIKRYSAVLEPIKDIRIESTLSVFNEKFRWQKIGKESLPIWISVGLTPLDDQPAHNPWEKDFRDYRAPRIYFVTESGSVRTLSLKEDETPLFFEGSNSIIIASGTGYIQNFYRLTLLGNTTFQKEELKLDHYRMLIGASDDLKIFGTPHKDSELGYWTSSGIGHLRLNSLSSKLDVTLLRGSTLEALIQPLALYQLNEFGLWGAWAQSHYDLKFFTGTGPTANNVFSTSLNRYSFIPSMIVNRSFFPFASQNKTGEMVAGVFIPASIANDNIAEIVFANPKEKKVEKPALLRVAIPESCLLSSNLFSQNNLPNFLMICAEENARELQWVRVPIQPLE